MPSPALRAKSGSGHAYALKKVTEQLICPVCLKDYTKPRVLSCFHAFCTECLTKMISHGRPRQGSEREGGQAFIVCPNCRLPTHLSPQGASGLQSAFHIYNLFDIRDELLKEPREERDSRLFCDHHPEEEAKIYCEECKMVGCVKCVYEMHKDHPHQLISNVIEKHRAELEAFLKPVTDFRTQLKRSIKPLKACVEEIASQRADLEKEIKFVFAEVASELEARKSSLLKQVEQVADEKLEALQNQRKHTERTLDMVTGCVKQVEGALKMGSAAQVMDSKDKMMQQLSDLVDSTKTSSPLKPVEGATTKFSYCAEELIDALKDFGMVYTYDVCPEKCTATGEGLSQATVGQRASAVLQAINSRDCVCEQPVQSLDCKLVCRLTGSEVLGQVERGLETLQSFYNLSFTPLDKGLHRLEVCVEGRHIRGSPFRVCVSSTQEMEEPFFTLHDLECPMGVALTPEDKIVVTESKGNCVSIFTPDSKRKTFGSTGSKKGEFVDPRGVLVDTDGNILVLDAGNRRLQKFSPDGTFMSCLDTGADKFNLPTDIALNPKDSNYYIVDHKGHSVCVVSPDLKLVRRFGERGNGRGQLWYPSGVTCDEEGKVYVSDGNHRVQVFTPEGQCVRRMGKEGVGEGCLKSPSGLVLCAGLLYVSEWDNNRVSVFSAADGRFVRSFCGRGMLQHPAGMTVDSSGILYLCNSENNCLHLF